MKPLNSAPENCNPISSNCVIWQGPNVPCLKLCKGDTVSDVVNKLATELCEITTTLDINTYDLTCFNIVGCAPEDFQALIQFLISQICTLVNNQSDNAPRLTAGCPDCIVPIAPCFQYVNQFGDTVTTMQLADYAKTIGNKICDLINQIANINVVLANHETRITTLENKPDPVVVLPQIIPTCVLPPTPTDMASLLAATERQLCELRSATGMPNEMYQAIAKQCVNLNNLKALGPYGGYMSGLPGWYNNVANLAQSFQNMWLTLCDLRAAVINIKETCCASGCDGIELSFNGIISGSNLILYITGTIPAGFADCNPLGNVFTITDTTGGSVSIRIDVTSQLNIFGGTVISLASSPINLSSDLTIDSDVCLFNSSTNATCQICISYLLKNQANCPILTLSSLSDTTVDYSFAVVNVPGTYTLELWDNSGTAVVATYSTVVTVANTITGTFTGLAPSTTYKGRLVITVGGVTTTCPFISITTIPVVCNPPTGVGALLSGPCSTCGSAIDFVSNPGIDGYYADDNSPYLLKLTSSSFGNMLDSIDTNIVSGAAGGSFDRGKCFADGKLFVYNRGAKTVEVYNNNVLSTTITLNRAINDICFDANENVLYYLSNDSGKKVGTIDPVTYAFTDDIGITFPGTSILLVKIFYNPVSFEKYIIATTGSKQELHVISTNPAPILQITINTATIGLGAWEGASYVGFNEVTGEAWVVENYDTPGSSLQILVIDPTTYAFTAVNTTLVGLAPVKGSAGGAVSSITYYPGDGSVGSDRMFVLFRDNPFTQYTVVEFIVTGPYTDSSFVTSSITGSANILWSTVFNKIILSVNSTIKVYNPFGSTPVYATITGAFTPFYLPVEDTTNKNIVFHGYANGTTNLDIIGLNSTEAVLCTQGIVEMYLSEVAGPFTFNSTTSTWDPISVYSSIVDGGATFTLTALLTSNYSAIVVYSDNNGLTWNTLGTYKTAAEWAVGVTLIKPAGNFIFRLAILTDTGCGLTGASNTTFN